MPKLLKDMTFKDPSKGVTKPTFGRMFLNSIKFDDDLFHAFDVAVGHHANGFWRDRGGKLALDWVHPNMKTAWDWLGQRWADKVVDPDSLTAQLDYWGQPWTAGTIGTMYSAPGPCGRRRSSTCARPIPRPRSSAAPRSRARTAPRASPAKAAVSTCRLAPTEEARK